MTTAANAQTHHPSITRMNCQALRSDAQSTCSTMLGYAASAVRFASLAARAPAQPDGKHWVRCARCKMWNSFEAVAE